MKKIWNILFCAAFLLMLLIPLCLTLGLFFLMKKKNWKPVQCIALLLVIGLLGALVGIF